MRVFNDMTEIVLDVPSAYHTLSKFVEHCFKAGFISSVVAEELPQRSVNHRLSPATLHTQHTHTRTHAHTHTQGTQAFRE